MEKGSSEGRDWMQEASSAGGVRPVTLPRGSKRTGSMVQSFHPSQVPPSTPSSSSSSSSSFSYATPSTPAAAKPLYPSLGSFQSPPGSAIAPVGGRQPISTPLRGRTPGAGGLPIPAAKRRKKVIWEDDRVRIESVVSWPDEVVRRLEQTNLAGK